MGPGKLRTVSVLAATTALSIASAVPSGAQSAPTGVGSSSGATSLLTLALGEDTLGLRLVGEDAATSNDPAAGGPSALERISPLQITSTLVPALAALSAPSLETRSTSGEDTESSPAIDLAGLVAGAPVPGLLSGTIDPLSLRSAVDATGAVSTAGGAVRDLAVVGGLLRAGAATVDLGSQSLVTDAEADRGLQLDRLEVLDLTALLDALGISLGDLPVDTAIDLLARLGLPVPGGLSVDALRTTIDSLLTQTSAVRAQVSTLAGQLAAADAQLAAANAQVASLTAQLAEQQALLATCGLACAPIQALIASLTAELTAATADAASLQSTVSSLQAQIDALLAPVQALVDQLLGLLDGILDGLDGAALVVVEDLVVGLTARADDTLATSVASVVGSVGDVRVGGVSLGGLDVGAATAQVTALGDQVAAALGDILALVDPSLAGLVDIGLFEQQTSLTQQGASTNALAAVTALRVTVDPPDVCALLDTVTGGLAGTVQGTVDTLLAGVGEQLPALPAPVSGLLAQVGSTLSCDLGAAAPLSVSALTEPLDIRALSLSGASTFVLGTTTSAPRLPATGGEVPFALLALGLGVLGATAHRVVRRSA